MQTLDAASTDKLALAVWHLRLLERALGRTHSSAAAALDEGYRLDVQFYTFGLLHLIATLFLLDGKGARLGGYIYPALKSLGMERETASIARTLGASLGPVSFGDFIRYTRNKLATHGDLTEASLPFDLSALRESPKWVARHDQLFERLTRDLGRLTRRLEARLLAAQRRLARKKAPRAA